MIAPALLVVAGLLASPVSARVDDAPIGDAPSVDVPTGDAPPVDAPPIDAPMGDGSPDEAAPDAPASEAAPDDDDGGSSVPAPDAPDDDGFWSPVLLGSTFGCASAGALPAALTTVGLATVYGASLSGSAFEACNGAGGALLGAVGVATAIPPMLALGPCASLGAMCGGIGGALLADKDLWTVFVWSTPGLLLGTLGGLVGVGGLLVLVNSDPGLAALRAPLGTTLIVIGATAATLAGPISVVGESVTTRAATSEPEAKPVREDGVDAGLVVPPSTRRGAEMTRDVVHASASMAF